MPDLGLVANYFQHPQPVAAPLVLEKRPQGYFLNYEGVWVSVEVKVSTSFWGRIWDSIRETLGFAHWLTAEIQVRDIENYGQLQPLCIRQINIIALADLHKKTTGLASAANMQMEKALKDSQAALNRIGQGKNPNAARTNASEIQASLETIVRQNKKVENAFAAMRPKYEIEAERLQKHYFHKTLAECAQELRSEGSKRERIPYLFRVLLNHVPFLKISWGERPLTLTEDDLDRIERNRAILKDCDKALGILKLYEIVFKMPKMKPHDAKFLMEFFGKILELSSEKDSDTIYDQFCAALNGNGAIPYAGMQRILKSAIGNLNKENLGIFEKLETLLKHLEEQTAGWGKTFTVQARTTSTTAVTKAHLKVLSEPLTGQFEEARLKIRAQNERVATLKRKISELESTKHQTYAAYKKAEAEIRSLRKAL